MTDLPADELGTKRPSEEPGAEGIPLIPLAPASHRLETGATAHKETGATAREALAEAPINTMARKEDVRIVHDVTGARRRPSSFRLAVGLILVAAAASVTFISSDRWQAMFAARANGGGGSLPGLRTGWKPVPQLPGVPQVPGVSQTRAAGAAPATMAWWIPWTQWGAAGVLLILGGLCLPTHLLHYLLTAALVCASAFCVNLLLGGVWAWPWMVLLGASLGYAIHLGKAVAVPSLRGVIGWALIAFSCVACVRGWFDWAAISTHLGRGAQGFFESWGHECTWGTIIVLTAIGVSCSQTRPIHFLSAVLLVALAFYCIQQGKVAVVTFPELGQHVRPLHIENLGNIPLWRWVLAGELVLMGAILLHMALGVGALTLAFAVVWLAAGMQVDRAIGRLTMARLVGQFGGSIVREAEVNGHPLADGTMGLPVAAAPGAAANEVVAAPKPLDSSLLIGAVTPTVWLYLTAVLAGFIGVGGLRMLSDHPGFRTWSSVGLWFVFGMGLMWLWSVWPRDPEQSWGRWLSTWGLSRYHVQAVWLAALGVAAISGSWALREGSRYEYWLYVAAGCIALGTVLSLVAVALLIRFGGFSPLPAWAYVTISAGQSSIMWVLLMHLSLRSRRVPGRSTRE